MTAVNYNKPLKAKYVIEGVTDENEMRLAEEILFRVYDIAAKIINNGGVEWFNCMWKTIHPRGETGDEYHESYEKLFKYVADEVSEVCRVNGIAYKLRENEPCLINFEAGYFIIYGYKDAK